MTNKSGNSTHKTSKLSDYTKQDLLEEFGDLEPKLKAYLTSFGLKDIIDAHMLRQSRDEEIENELIEIDDQHKSACLDHPDTVASSDLTAAILALLAIRSEFKSDGLERLLTALRGLAEGGSPPAMLTPHASTGRRPESAAVQIVRGILAAMVKVKQKRAKLTREEAAEWVLNNLSQNLLGRLSSKPITRRTLIDWMDDVGGKSGRPGPGASAYRENLQIMMGFKEDIRSDDCLSLSDKMAMRLPVLRQEKHRKPPLLSGTSS